MDVFISHSWRDKTTADIFADDIKPMCHHVWIDANQVMPGNHNQQAISQFLPTLDLVIVIWTAQAAESQNIEMQLAKCIELGIKVIPCLFDDTPLSTTIQHSQYIDFRDYPRGFAQLALLLLNMTTKNSQIDDNNDITNKFDLHKVINYLQDKPPASAAGIIDAATRVLIHTAQLQNRATTNEDYVQQIFHQLHKAGRDRDSIQSLLYDVTINEFQDKDVLRRMRSLLECELNRTPLVKMPPHPGPYADMPFQPTPTLYLQTLTDEQLEKKQIRQGLQDHVEEKALPEAIDAVHYYIVTSVDMLGLIHDIALNSESESELTIVKYLYRYLQTPHTLLAEANHGAWGLIDEAWMIHNTTYRMIEAGLFTVELFPFDWAQIAAADNIVVHCLPPVLARQLEALLMQFMNLIALEIKDYQPTFCHDENHYHPYIGQAQAVGIQFPQADYCSYMHL